MMSSSKSFSTTNCGLSLPKMLSGANTLKSVIFKKMKLKQANQEIGM